VQTNTKTLSSSKGDFQIQMNFRQPGTSQARPEKLANSEKTCSNKHPQGQRQSRQRTSRQLVLVLVLILVLALAISPQKLKHLPMSASPRFSMLGAQCSVLDARSPGGVGPKKNTAKQKKAFAYSARNANQPFLCLGMWNMHE